MITNCQLLGIIRTRLRNLSEDLLQFMDCWQVAQRNGKFTDNFGQFWFHITKIDEMDNFVQVWLKSTWCNLNLLDCWKEWNKLTFSRALMSRGMTTSRWLIFLKYSLEANRLKRKPNCSILLSLNRTIFWWWLRTGSTNAGLELILWQT